MFQDRDEAWVDVNDKFTWLDGGARLLYVSERDGWRHAYAVSREGDARLITTGAFDIASVAAVDAAGGWLYYVASPDNATQRYLYRSRLDGSGAPERITPSDEPGTHSYNISPDAHWAFHTYSKFDDPGISELVRLPNHKTVRVSQDNKSLKAKVAPILAGRTEFYQVTADDGAKVDGWLIRPSHFDPAKKYPLIVNVYGERRRRQSTIAGAAQAACFTRPWRMTDIFSRASTRAGRRRSKGGTGGKSSMARSA